MSQTAILFPLITMIAMTLLVMMVMLRRRGHCLRQRGVSVSQLPGTRETLTHMAEGPLWDTRTAAANDQVTNLFETPVLFYVLCLTIYVTNSVTGLTLILAWGFVLARMGHAFVHLTYNLVNHRLFAFMASLIALIALSISLLISIL